MEMTLGPFLCLTILSKYKLFRFHLIDCYFFKGLSIFRLISTLNKNAHREISMHEIRVKFQDIQRHLAGLQNAFCNVASKMIQYID